MNPSALHVVPEHAAYRPGDEIRGTVSWALESAPASAELRLFWQTKGKGDTDVEVVASLAFEAPAAAESRPFAFAAPSFPYSFSGKLISLEWVLELVMDPGGAAMVSVILSPSGEEILLHQEGGIAMEEPGKKSPWRKS